jgi:hypothetical protein
VIGVLGGNRSECFHHGVRLRTLCKAEDSEAIRKFYAQVISDYGGMLA